MQGSNLRRRTPTDLQSTENPGLTCGNSRLGGHGGTNVAHTQGALAWPLDHTDPGPQADAPPSWGLTRSCGRLPGIGSTWTAGQTLIRRFHHQSRSGVRSVKVATPRPRSPAGRRTLELPQRCVVALRTHQERQDVRREAAGRRWTDLNLVFACEHLTPLDAANVRRSFRAVVKAVGLVATDWTPRELRHSFVSLLSSSGVPIEDISRLGGHWSTNVTEKVYRHELRPVMTRGAATMDQIFKPMGDRRQELES